MQKPGPRGVGAALGFITVMMWGTQFTVTKVLFRNLDAFAVTSLRYGFGGAILAGILGAMAVAFVGSLLVIAQGDPRTFVEGGIGWGVILCFFGQFTWVLYTAELPRFTGWSILRTTTLTSMTGRVAVLAVFGIALLAGASDLDFGALGSDWGYVV